MSFILDALKKAEAERSRQIGPVLMDVRIAAPRQGLPTWAWVLGGVLLANLLVLAWLLLRRPPAPASPVLTASAVVTTPKPAVVAAIPATAPNADAAAVVGAPTPSSTPAAGAAPAMAPTMVAEEPRATDQLPTMQELIASGVTLPALQLNLHVYDQTPGNRFVLLNSRHLGEGDELPDGTRVERITQDGVVLVVRGRRFLLPAGG